MKTFLLFLTIPILFLSFFSIVVSQEVQAAAPRAPEVESVTIDQVPRISTMVVDGRLYLSNELPFTFSWTKGSIHNILVEQTEVNESVDKRYVFQRWTDLSEEPDRTFVVGDNINLRAIYKEQYNLRIISDHGDVYGKGWYDKGQTAAFGVKPTLLSDDELDGHRFAFASWDLGNSPKSPTNSITIQGPTTVKAIWYDQYYLEVSSSLSDAIVGGSGWYDRGQKVTLAADKELETGIRDTKFVLDGWTSLGNYAAVLNTPKDGGNPTLFIDNPYRVQAVWKKAYYLNVQSPYGTPAGSGYYPEGTVATISMPRTEIVTKSNERIVFDGWTGKGVLTSGESGSGQVRVTDPATVTAMWKTQYYLGVSSSGGGSTSGSGWYDAGSTAAIGAEEPAGMSGFWTKTAFDRWTGDLSDGSAKASVKMDSPKTVKAQWREDYSPAVINSGILIGVMIAGALAFKKFRKRKKELFHRPELVGGIIPSDFADSPWKGWRAKIVKRPADDAEPAA